MDTCRSPLFTFKVCLSALLFALCCWMSAAIAADNTYVHRGFHVSGSSLYDANGNRFIMRELISLSAVL